MSANELSRLIKEHILPALDKDLRPQLDTAVQDLELDSRKTKLNIKNHFEVSPQKASQIFNFVIQDIITYKDKTTGDRMFQSRPSKMTGGRKWVFSFGGFKKTQVKGRGWVESQMTLSSRYSKFVKWKSDLGNSIDSSGK